MLRAAPRGRRRRAASSSSVAPRPRPPVARDHRVPARTSADAPSDSDASDPACQRRLRPRRRTRPRHRHAGQRPRVSVLYGEPGGIARGPRRSSSPPQQRLAASRRRGYGLRAPRPRPRRRRLADLLVGAPGKRRASSRHRRDAVLRFGGQDGLTAIGRACCPAAAGRDWPASARGSAPATSTTTGTSTSSRAPRRCRPRPATAPTAAGPGADRSAAASSPRRGGTSGLAVADVNGDGYADIVQGDAEHAGRFLSPGEVRLWLGSRRGPRSEPLGITQDTPGVPGGSDEPGDEFGAVVDAGDVDLDGFADIIVGAIREDEGAGQITVIRGGENGHASVGNTQFDQDSREGAGVGRSGSRVRRHAHRPRA